MYWPLALQYASAFSPPKVSWRRLATYGLSAASGSIVTTGAAAVESAEAESGESDAAPQAASSRAAASAAGVRKSGLTGMAQRIDLRGPVQSVGSRRGVAQRRRAHSRVTVGPPGAAILR